MDQRIDALLRHVTRCQAAEVSKRVDIFAAALFHGMRVAELCDLDLAYTPLLSSPRDAVQMAAMHWCAEQGRCAGLLIGKENPDRG